MIKVIYENGKVKEADFKICSNEELPGFVHCIALLIRKLMDESFGDEGLGYRAELARIFTLYLSDASTTFIDYVKFHYLLSLKNLEDYEEE